MIQKDESEFSTDVLERNFFKIQFNDEHARAFLLSNLWFLVLAPKSDSLCLRAATSSIVKGG